MTAQVNAIIQHYHTRNAGVKSQILRLLQTGTLAASGKLVILPVDQGFEHGPDRSFFMNPAAYTPQYHAAIAYEAGLSGFAAPLGMLEMVADEYASKLPLILKLNNAMTLGNNKDPNPDQAFTATVEQALRLGCCAVGLTIYPGSSHCNTMLEKAREVIDKAHQHGLAAIVWAYPRGHNIEKHHESALDIVSYAAHVACLIGADIIKVKLPNRNVLDDEVKKIYANANFTPETSDLATRVKHVVKSAFDGGRIIIFSGGASKDTNDLLSEIKAIKQGGGHGSIIGRNIFQRPRQIAMQLLHDILNCYKQ